jgi:hypothetical protein
VAVVVLLFVVAVVWATPREAGDTFMALAGGRDVFEGKLAKPDDWAFTTVGSIWLNQNWGFDALAYIAISHAGEAGLLVLKALLIAVTAAATVVACRARGATWSAALLVTAAALAGARHFVELRANTTSYILVSLLLVIIYRSRSRPGLIWISVPLIAVWANVHGGFMLGLALLGLWLGASSVSALARGGLQEAIRRSAGPAGALASSVALAAVANPFGIRNLTYPFAFVSSPEWREVTEWHSLSFTPAAGQPSAWEFVAFLAFVLLVTGWRALGTPPAAARRTNGEAQALDLAFMDIGLFIAMAFVGFSAFRFLPVALVVLAPLAARQASVVFRDSTTWLPTTVAAGVLTIVTLPFANRVRATYSADNPRFSEATIFQRMTASDLLPCGAVDFLEDNNVDGRIFSEWAWEGYLHWRRPQLRLFIGGRATQIYGLDTVHAYRALGNAPRPATMLAQWDIHLVVVPLEREYLQVVDRLAFSDGSHWALVFYDGRTAVLADLVDGKARDLAEGVAAGRARFRSEAVSTLSRALERVSFGSGGVGTQALSDLVTANRNLPTAGGPWFLLFTARAHRVQLAWLVHTLEAEYGFLTSESGRKDGQLERLQARLSCAQILASLYGRGTQASFWIQTREQLIAQLRTLVANL